MMPQPPPGQGPIDPRGAFSPPPAPGGGSRPSMPPNMPPQMMMPPPYFPPPPRRGGGAGRVILILLATISIIFNFCLLAYVVLPGGSESAAEASNERLQKGHLLQRFLPEPSSA